MSLNDTIPGGRGSRQWTYRLAALALAWGGGALAQEVVTVPAAHLHHVEGSVAYAPHGDKEWHDVQPRRLLKRGDRLWTDPGSRAEVQAGGHALRLDGETQLVLENVGETATQLSLTQGSIVATVTRLNPGDSFEVGTPNLAFRARQPGDYRIDVDAKKGMTRLVVLSGLGVVFGEKGEALEVRAGQRAVFRERTLARVQQPLFAAVDDFDRWAGARRRGEPTVSMPVAGQAAAPAAPPATRFVNKGPDLIIKGSAAEVAASTGIPARSASRVLSPPASVTAPVAQAASAKPIPTTSGAPAPLQVMVPATPARPTAAQIQAAAAAAQAQAAAEAQRAAQAQAEARAQAAAQAKAEAAAQVKAQAEAAAQAQAAQRQAQAQAHAQEAQARAQARARAAAQAQASAREQQEHQRRVVAQREEERRAALHAEQDRRRGAQASEGRRAVAARRVEEDRQRLHARHDAEQKRVAAARRAEEDRRQAQARRVAEEKRLLAARRAAETQKIIDAQRLAESRRLQLARLQEQARRDEQTVQARREQQSRRMEEARREDQARREEAAQREEQARREEDYRRQRALAEQARREQARREEEVWLRQQQPPQPARPVPMGVPIRRVS